MMGYVFIFPIIAALVGYLLGSAARYWSVARNPAIDTICDLLPNGQCGQCGYPGCQEAAKAIFAGHLEVTGCPLTDASVNQKIAEIVGVEISDSPQSNHLIAGIQTSLCDGCGRCIKQCSFDAIVGAPKQLHGIVATACTGCKKCVAICPHGCVEMYPDPAMMNPLAKPSMHMENHHV